MSACNQELTVKSNKERTIQKHLDFDNMCCHLTFIQIYNIFFLSSRKRRAAFKTKIVKINKIAF